MERKLNWTFSLLITSFIGLSSSAVFFPFVHENPEKAYDESRSASVYRGVFLSYSSPIKTDICRDLFFEYSNDKSVISDDLENEGQPQHSLIVGKISQFVEHYWLEETKEDIFFKCSGKNLKPELSADIEYFVSSTFHHGFIYNGAEEYMSENKIAVMLNGYIGMSPVPVPLEQTDLEKQFVASRRILNALKKESPLYAKMIEQRNDLSALSEWQKFLLCSSTILSSNSVNDDQTLSLNWIEYKKNVEKKEQHALIRLTFNDNNYEKEIRWANCLYCTPRIEAAGDSRTIKRNLLLTSAYNDKHSLYVLLEENGVIRLKKYVENVPILMNAHARFTDDPEYIHISELE